MKLSFFQELEGEKGLLCENIKHLEGLRDNLELNISDKEGLPLMCSSQGSHILPDKSFLKKLLD